MLQGTGDRRGESVVEWRVAEPLVQLAQTVDRQLVSVEEPGGELGHDQAVEIRRLIDLGVVERIESVMPNAIRKARTRRRTRPGLVAKNPTGVSFRDANWPRSRRDGGSLRAQRRGGVPDELRVVFVFPAPPQGAHGGRAACAVAAASWSRV